MASLTNWLSVCLQTKWLWVWVPLQSLKLQILRLFRARNSLTFRQLTIECRFTLKHVPDMVRKYSHINDKSKLLLLQNINNLQAQIKTLIDISKQNYFYRILQKLVSTSLYTKCYWFLLKTFINNKKFPCIPPLYNDDKFVCGF